jgi:alpha-beta hydrolase superfamily lysophospholipase
MAARQQTVEHTIPGGSVLRGLAWRAERPRAVLVLAHGINEHIGRYALLGERLSEAGYALIGVDHRGHGLTAGDAPRTSNIRRFDDYVDDYIAFFDATRVESAAPTVMIGHSMGGLIAVRAALRAQDQAAALVLSGPALKLVVTMPGWQQRIALVIARFLPNLALPKGDGSALSRDPAVRLAVQSDPLFINEPTRLGIARQLYLLSEETRARAAEIRIPLLAMHGGADTVTDPEGTRMFVEQAASTDKEFVSWPDDLHEIFNEVDREAVVARLISWLDHRFLVA